MTSDHCIRTLHCVAQQRLPLYNLKADATSDTAKWIVRSAYAQHSIFKLKLKYGQSSPVHVPVHDRSQHW